MDNLEIIMKVKEYVIKHYNADACALTAERSMGNFDDVFYDGRERGEAWTLYAIAELMGFQDELENPVEADNFGW